MTSIREFEQKLGEWADAQFGAGDQMRCLKHLRHEVGELIAAPYDRMEYADCFMLLVDAYRRAGGNADDLIQASYEKLEICKKRKWGKPDAEGVIRHVDN